MKTRVAVLFGGVSVEHEISIISAIQAMSAMNTTIYDIIPVYIGKDGSFYSDKKLMNLDVFKSNQEITTMFPQVSFLTRHHHHYIVPVKKHGLRKDIPFDIAFPILHGTNGEDGSIQGYLKTLQIPYVGCDVIGGAIGQDKAIMKMILQDRGLPLLPWFYWTSDQKRDDTLFEKVERLSYPVILKPANLGSSIGIHIAHDQAELQSMIEDAFHYDHKVVIEHALTNMKEINASVRSYHDTLYVSTLEEVLKEDAILSFHDKYIGKNKAKGTKGMGNTRRIVPALLDEDIVNEIRMYAKETYTVLEANGVVRIDFIIDEHQQIYVNEINTIPGSLSSYLWEAEGLPFTKLIDMLLEEAIRTYRKQQRLTMHFDTNVLRLYGQGQGSKK